MMYYNINIITIIELYYVIGIRTLGVPIFTATSGTVAGPTWGLMLMGDYRTSG